jgi:hypothetical protein
MGKEIRLFLCLRSVLSGERVSVHRTLEDAKAQWLEERANCPEVSGLLHAGADRPSYDTFRATLESHKGYLFLTEATRWLLDDVHVESRVAAAILGTIPRQRNQPLYLAIVGWGYDISFGRRNEKTPLSRADDISREAFAQRMKTINAGDPFEIARICPEGLIGVALSEISMPVRCQNVLVKQELSTVGQLQDLYLRDALHWANFGKKSAVDLAEALRCFIDSRTRAVDVCVSAPNGDRGSEEDAAPNLVSATPATTLQQELNEFIALLKPSQKKVLEERVLNQKSLEQVGEFLGVTRERVRQIESRLLDTLGKSLWVKSLRERVSTLLNRRSDPLFLDLIEVEDPWFSGWSFQARELAALISAFPSDLTILRSQDRIIVSRISQDVFDRILKNAVGFLAQQVSEDWSREDVELFIEGALRSEKAPDLARLAIELLGPELHFSHMPSREKEILCSVGSDVNEIIMAILGNAEAPLHYSEIASALAIRMGKELTVHNIHARLPRTPALFFGRGRYGVEAHYLLSAEVEMEVVGVVEDVMAADPERQWHTTELLEALEARGEDLPDALDKYILNILLSRSKEFQDMGRMVWSLKAVHRTDARGRIDLRDACVQVLIESGHALHNREIKERIGRLRGTSEFFFLQPTERMARVAPNKWGLVERDFGLTMGERTTFLAGLEFALEKRAISLHVSELSKLVETQAGEERMYSVPTDYMLMGLVQTDPRFRVHRGRLIALRTWSDARRPTLRSAVGQTLCEGRAEVSVTALVVELEALVGREVQRGEVTNALLQRGWRRQGLTETYVASFMDEEEAAEGSLDTSNSESSCTAV